MVSSSRFEVSSGLFGGQDYYLIWVGFFLGVESDQHDPPSFSEVRAMPGELFLSAVLCVASLQNFKILNEYFIVFQNSCTLCTEVADL